MANSYWKTGVETSQPKQITWPSIGQLLRQLGLAILIVAIWSGLFFAYLRLSGGGAAEVAAIEAAEPAPTPAEVLPTETPTQPATDTPAPLPTDTPTVEAANVDDQSPAEESGAEPSPTASDTPTPESTPTATSLPPTDTPVANTETAGISFSEDVFPIIDRRCTKCHGGGTNDDGTPRIEEGLNMLTYEDLLAGSWNGPVIEPGNVEDSYLIEQIVTGEMPKKEPNLLPGEIRTITAWVEAGAPNN